MPQQQHPFAPQQDPGQLPDPNNRPLIVDGSLWLHAPKALLWLLTEATVIALSCYDHYVGKPSLIQLPLCSNTTTTWASSPSWPPCPPHVPASSSIPAISALETHR